MSIQSLLEAYARGEDARATHAGHRWVRTAGWGALVLAMLSSLGLALWTLWRSWQSDDWRQFAAALAIVALVCSVPLALRIARSVTTAFALPAAVAALRHAVSQPDDTLLPLADPQPAAGESLACETKIAPIERLRQPPYLWLAVGFVPLGTMALPLLFGGALTSLYDISSQGQSSLIPILDGITFGSIYVILFGGLLLAFVWRLVLPFGSVRVDASGARWRRGWRWRRLLWAEARAFLRVSYQAAQNTPHRTAYLLDTPRGALAWELSATASDRRYNASRTLTSAIITHTRLPLRDATNLVTRLSESQVERTRAIAELGLATPAAPRRPVTWRWVVAILALLVPFGGLAASGFAAHGYQQSYFTSLPARLRAESPLYTDALTAPDADWPIYAAQAGNPTHTAYESGAYVVRGWDQQPAVALAPGSYGDAAVAVSVRQIDSPTPSDPFPAYGLLLRRDPSSGYGVVLWMDGEGHTTLSLYQGESYVDILAVDFLSNDGYAAIQRDLRMGNPARLLVIMRGGLYLCYLNDQLVLTYDASSESRVPRSGQVGLWVDDGAVGGAFSDFAVYPVQPSSAFWYV